MQSESPMSSPDIDFYEECVVAEEDTSISPTKLADQLSTPAVPRVNKDTGRVTKKSNVIFVMLRGA